MVNDVDMKHHSAVVVLSKNTTLKEEEETRRSQFGLAKERKKNGSSDSLMFKQFSFQRLNTRDRHRD